jgi:hypothetical protein
MSIRSKSSPGCGGPKDESHKRCWIPEAGWWTLRSAMTGADLQAVHNLLAQYGLLLDRLAVEEWLDLFTDDAVLEIDGTALDSREKRRELTATAPCGLHLSNLPVLEGDL